VGSVNRMAEIADRELLYVGDPMCSWCWGISPQLDKLIELLPGISFRILAGGLRPGPNAQELTDEFVQFLAVEWSAVNAHTGQPFDFAILQREDWIYDTEAACRAVTVMGELDEPLAWPLFKRIQHAFYAEGVLVTNPDSYPALVSDVGGDPDKFMEMFLSDEATRLVWDDFATVRSWGITSFPTVIFREGQTGNIIAQGYATAEAMKEIVDELS
jgi:putative protein-disulfide isomerase